MNLGDNIIDWDSHFREWAYFKGNMKEGILLAAILERLPLGQRGIWLTVCASVNLEQVPRHLAY